MPHTPDEFPGINQAEGLLFIEDGYGLPGTKREIRYSDGYFYAYDEYGIFNIRTNVQPHIYSHTAGGTDSFYVVSNNPPTIDEDINDGYAVGWRWINLSDAYEYVLIDNTAGSAIWINTTGGGSGGGISESDHETLDTLVHEIDETSFDEHTYVRSKLSNVTTWSSSAKTLKIREEQYTYSASKITQVVTIQYDNVGAVKMTVTETYTYSGNVIVSVTRVKS